jgi:hypothetical protein
VVGMVDCRRLPPVPEKRFPVLNENAWCGEFHRRDGVI